MTRAEIVARINQKMYEGLYTFDQIKDDLDDAIITINNTMNTKYPPISEVLTEDNSEYKYTKTLEDETTVQAFIFPEQYVRSVVIEYTVSELFRREGEFGHEFQTSVRAYENNLFKMFRDHFDLVPDQFIDEDSGVIPIIPYEIVEDVNE